MGSEVNQARFLEHAPQRMSLSNTESLNPEATFPEKGHST